VAHEPHKADRPGKLEGQTLKIRNIMAKTSHRVIKGSSPEYESNTNQKSFCCLQAAWVRPGQTLLNLKDTVKPVIKFEKGTRTKQNKKQVKEKNTEMQ